MTAELLMAMNSGVWVWNYDFERESACAFEKQNRRV